MSQLTDDQTCPRCGASHLKGWNDLSADERILAERLPASAEFTPAERKRHRFCTRCWFESPEREVRT